MNSLENLNNKQSIRLKEWEDKDSSIAELVAHYSNASKNRESSISKDLKWGTQEIFALDSIVGVDKKAYSFWLRITGNYNQYHGLSREKLQDEGVAFNLEYAWWLLKDEPKWMGASTKNSLKRIKNYASKAHSSSYEYNSSLPMERPMGKKTTKSKCKAKENANASEYPSNVVQDTWNKRVAEMEILAQCKEEEMEFKAIKLIMKDTSTMNDSQRDIHEKYCKKLKEKYGY
ncbi:uncharacterized protein LOC131639561 [Vicia villosa]|uniref:uncharacterized protein LOC131639561 n=1 Tax=Vicia villosa TaxID=3911 RepID=UPI00273C5EC6|nr:uncharacterized protein LOC131639561 [Vicia villosa]